MTCGYLKKTGGSKCVVGGDQSDGWIIKGTSSARWTQWNEWSRVASWYAADMTPQKSSNPGFRCCPISRRWEESSDIGLVRVRLHADPADINDPQSCPETRSQKCCWAEFHQDNNQIHSSQSSAEVTLLFHGLCSRWKKLIKAILPSHPSVHQTERSRLR